MLLQVSRFRKTFSDSGTRANRAHYLRKPRLGFRATGILLVDAYFATRHFVIGRFGEVESTLWQCEEAVIATDRVVAKETRDLHGKAEPRCMRHLSRSRCTVPAWDDSKIVRLGVNCLA